MNTYYHTNLSSQIFTELLFPAAGKREPELVSTNYRNLAQKIDKVPKAKTTETAPTPRWKTATGGLTAATAPPT